MGVNGIAYGKTMSVFVCALALFAAGQSFAAEHNPYSGYMDSSVALVDAVNRDHGTPVATGRSRNPLSQYDKDSSVALMDAATRRGPSSGSRSTGTYTTMNPYVQYGTDASVALVDAVNRGQQDGVATYYQPSRQPAPVYVRPTIIMPEPASTDEDYAQTGNSENRGVM